MARSFETNWQMPYTRRIIPIRNKCAVNVTCVTKSRILIISICTSRFGIRIKLDLAAIVIHKCKYILTEYTLFQEHARKILRPAPTTGHPGPAQSGHTPEFGYRPLHDFEGLEAELCPNMSFLEKKHFKVSITAKKSGILIHNVILGRYVPSPILNYVL